jgi:hypothetical protein
MQRLHKLASTEIRILPRRPAPLPAAAAAAKRPSEAEILTGVPFDPRD